ncbi:MAG: rhodanese-like domain-containing protein [Firmicutes bacterium]|nr:rhodanese-like domain-containing protein [Bacillota bacterium]
MKKIVMLCMCAMMLCSCGTEEKETEKVVSQNINCTQKEELMNEGAVLIDVRSASEYAEGHLDNSINLTVDTIGVNIEKLVSDKNTKIIVYCRSGNRSATAANTLINLGYKNVYDLGAMNNCSK